MRCSDHSRKDPGCIARPLFYTPASPRVERAAIGDLGTGVLIWLLPPKSRGRRYAGEKSGLLSVNGTG